VTNAGTCLRLLSADPPDVEGALETARRTLQDGQHATRVIGRLRAQLACKPALQSCSRVRDAERQRIARELHDTLLQGCQALVLRFQSIANRVPCGEALRNDIEDALNRADAVMAEGRARVCELRSHMSTGDLAGSLAEDASRIIAGDTPRFHLIVEGDQRALDALVGDEVLRIFEEAIRNVVKHANAKRIDANLTYGRQSLRLSVRDDGIGAVSSKLTSNNGNGHFGLVGMRERAERIGASLRISSREGRGTEVVMTAPAHIAYKRRRLWPLDRRSLSAIEGTA
jgi:signal transduction histidine kinase